jgi:hypothetical protein
MPSNRNRDPLARRTVRKFLIGFKNGQNRFLIDSQAGVQSHTSGGLTVVFNIPSRITDITDEAQKASKLETFVATKRSETVRALASAVATEKLVQEDVDQIKAAVIVDEGVRAGVVWFRLTSPKMIEQIGRGAHAPTVAQEAQAAIEVAAPVSNGDLDPIEGEVVAPAGDVIEGLEMEESER